MPGHVMFIYCFNKYLFSPSFVFVRGPGTRNTPVNKNRELLLYGVCKMTLDII